MSEKKWYGWISGPRSEYVCCVLALLWGLAAYAAYRRGAMGFAMFYSAAFGQNLTGIAQGGLFHR